jgi:hypothetical protein
VPAANRFVGRKEEDEEEEEEELFWEDGTNDGLEAKHLG